MESGMPHPNQWTKQTSACALVVLLLSSWYFTTDLRQLEHFGDESAILTETYYYRLLLQRDWHHVDWLQLAAYDHTPLFKYMAGAALHLNGELGFVPTTTQPWRDWMGNPRAMREYDRALAAPRRVAWFGAVYGCFAVFALGWRVMGSRTGLLAALLVMGSPLYARYAGRAMPDDWTQALVAMVLLSAAIPSAMRDASVLTWRAGIIWTVVTGLALAFAVSAKLNGATAGLILSGWWLMLIGACWRAQTPGVRFLQQTRPMIIILPISLVLGVFATIAINPFFWARPDFTRLPNEEVISAEQRQLSEWGILGRARWMLSYREQALRDAMDNPALQRFVRRGTSERLGAIVAGLGEHSVFGQSLYEVDVLTDRVNILEKELRTFPTEQIPQRLLSTWAEQWKKLSQQRWLPTSLRGVAQKLTESFSHNSRRAALLDEVKEIKNTIVETYPKIRRRNAWVGGALGLFSLLGAWFAWRAGVSRVKQGLLPISWLLVIALLVEIALLLRNLTLDFDRYHLGMVLWSSLLTAYGLASVWYGFWSRLILTPPPTETGPIP